MKQRKRVVVPENDTIVAQATPFGCGGVGVIRVSGGLVAAICKAVVGKLPKPRYAYFAEFLSTDQNIIDKGLVLYFPTPNSFTGEDVVEFHAHGGAIVLDQLLNTIINLGARLARPGEFSERAFLNGKIDLAQAEAIIDLVNANSEQAAKSAVRSLQGEFSQKINTIIEEILNLRTYIEAEIDFTEDDVEYLSSENIKLQLEEINKKLQELISKAEQGVLLRDGISVVIAGKPNVGKSSLLNLFCGQDSAIVTDIPGTTRDVLKEYINFSGLPLHIIDTAGIRDSADLVEQEGIKRAWSEIEKADFILLLTDSDDADIAPYVKFKDKLIVVRNKIDQFPVLKKQKISGIDTIYISIKTQDGVQELKNYLKAKVGYSVHAEGVFIARRRHLAALAHTKTFLDNAIGQIISNSARELCAEELRLAQNTLSKITGKIYTDNLLTKIFSEFCVGK